MKQRSFFSLCLAVTLFTLPATSAQNSDALVGIWTMDDGFQITELLFRSDGRYQLDTRSTDPILTWSTTERGRYNVDGDSLSLIPYDRFGEPQPKVLAMSLDGQSLTLERPEFSIVEVYQFKSGSRADVLARENVAQDLTGTWSRTIQFWGTDDFTFRPGGYYYIKSTPESGNFPPEYVRGRYEIERDELAITPYSGTEALYEVDIFGTTLTLIKTEDFFGESKSYELIPGSPAEIHAKAAEADAFVSQENWQVGLWEIRSDFQTVDLTLRPDGYYISNEETEFLSGIVRGRYTIESGRIHLTPFIGQGIYARSNGEFGLVPRTRVLDYWDGQLQFIDVDSISQWVTLAEKRPGTQEAVLQKVTEAQAEREQDDWYVGIWEVNDPTGWMEFTFRPDGRYIAMAGQHGVPGEVERGQYLVTDTKVTLAPYSGLGTARGFELDLYDGDLFLIGDFHRMVIARKVPGSENEVIQKATDPSAPKGERGGILGLWTANMPGQNVELVFRQDGEFRLSRCLDDSATHDYGLYTVNLGARTVLYDSRFRPVETRHIDFYGDTMTLHGGLSAPSTYKVNLGIVDSAIEASHAADAAEAIIDGQWLARNLITPRDTNLVHVPTGTLPSDPNPALTFENSTVFTTYKLYRRLILGFVYFNEGGTIKSVSVVNTREWHFFPNGRVAVLFKNHLPGLSYPTTIEDVASFWGAYKLDPKPTEKDILHLYAENKVLIETDSGDQSHMTLEDGRRHLFWEKDYMILQEWASEQKPIPCELPEDPDGSLMNTGLSLVTQIEPDIIGDVSPTSIQISGPAEGKFTLSGHNPTPATIVIEGTTSLKPPVVWQALETNTLPAGPFNLEIPRGETEGLFLRTRRE